VKYGALNLTALNNAACNALKCIRLQSEHSRDWDPSGYVAAKLTKNESVIIVRLYTK